MLEDLPAKRTVRRKNKGWPAAGSRVIACEGTACPPALSFCLALKHDCIRARFPNGALYQWEFVRRGGEPFRVDVPGRLTLDNADLTLQAARVGLGLAYSWRWRARWRPTLARKWLFQKT